MTGAKDMRVVRLAAVPAAQLAAISRTALDRPLTGSAELVVAVPSDQALVLGSMQRFAELGAHVDEGLIVTRRGSGGAEVLVGPGTVWMQLTLSSPSALVECEPGRLLNRYVRPLLRALTKVGALAHYYDRDWISASSFRPRSGGAGGRVDHTTRAPEGRSDVPSSAPMAAVSFGHDSGTTRSVVEAFVAVTTPFAVRARSSFLDKPARTLRALGVDADVDTGRVADAILDAYGTAYGIGALGLDTASEMNSGALAKDHSSAVTDDPRTELPWAATREEAIGIVAAGRDKRGRMRVGGELMASRDVIAQLEAEIAASDGDAARIDRAVDALAAPGVAMLGVKSLRSIREAIDEALRAS